MSILVTGAAGFIGQHLVRHLKNAGYLVAGLDLNPSEDCHLFFRGDITSDESMKEAKKVVRQGWGEPIDAVVHLAAVASPPIAQRDPALAWSTNVRGTNNVLQLALELDCKRVLFFSSAHVYGISPKYMPTDENHPLALHDTYTTTKIIGEQLCQLYYQNHGLGYAVLRLWNAYGPGQSSDYFIGKKISQARTNQLITVRNEGVTKDWVHVSDVCRAASMAINSDYVGPLNVGTGRETSLKEIVAVMSAHFDVPVTRENVPDEGPTRMCCDWGRIRRTLGWAPTVKFEEGLAELMRSEP